LEKERPDEMEMAAKTYEERETTKNAEISSYSSSDTKDL
jgi:hypothetical protein